VKCPVPHEINARGDIIPLESCSLCGGTGVVTHEQVGTLMMDIESERLSLIDTDLFGPVWMCQCPTFNVSRSNPPFCYHTVEAVKRMQGARRA